MRFTLFAAFVTNCLLLGDGKSKNTYRTEIVEFYDDIARKQGYSKEVVEILDRPVDPSILNTTGPWDRPDEPYDPYIKKDRDEIHIPRGNKTLLEKALGKPLLKTSTDSGPYEITHHRYFAVFNRNPKTLSVYVATHRVLNMSEPNKPEFCTHVFDFDIPPYKWSENQTFHDKIYSHQGMDNFEITVGYEGRNLTNIHNPLRSPIPRMMWNETEYIELTVDIANDEFIVKPHNQPPIKTNFVVYNMTDYVSEESAGFEDL